MGKAKEARLTQLNTVVYCQNNAESKYGHGIGIAYFLGAKNYLVTGATGFVGKVFIKMLRIASNAGQIFVLVIRAKDKEAALNSLKTENKLAAMPGDVCESDLGMDALTASEIADKVHVIVNSAANSNFDERYDVAPSVNAKGPSNLLSFVKTCKKIYLSLHVSTAYVNGESEGVIEEPSLSMEEIIIPGKKASLPRLDINDEMKLAANLKESVNDKEAAHQQMKVLGVQRAKIHGWPNTYSFTKAMGEMLITGMKGDIPTVILRPSVIKGTYKEPFPGWIEGKR
ncbi:fatty acyl-CoA reductase 2-like [Neltuma alba]|uniref:fatty acyl-CoA reductase 2-like n=1 Tax=Neltuma alba TaxID=207710 RepID=UPI0010A465F8|nr:fatty acyl-CoA reductase 2-like [Prosopis alba]